MVSAHVCSGGEEMMEETHVVCSEAFRVTTWG